MNSAAHSYLVFPKRVREAGFYVRKTLESKRLLKIEQIIEKVLKARFFKLLAMRRVPVDRFGKQKSPSRIQLPKGTRPSSALTLHAGNSAIFA